jgi:hypothetical protein
VEDGADGVKAITTTTTAAATTVAVLAARRDPGAESECCRVTGMHRPGYGARAITATPIMIAFPD